MTESLRLRQLLEKEVERRRKEASEMKVYKRKCISCGKVFYCNGILRGDPCSNPQRGVWGCECKSCLEKKSNISYPCIEVEPRSKKRKRTRVVEQPQISLEEMRRLKKELLGS